jgi:hypothetical protein
LSNLNICVITNNLHVRKNGAQYVSDPQNRRKIKLRPTYQERLHANVVVDNCKTLRSKGEVLSVLSHDHHLHTTRQKRFSAVLIRVVEPRMWVVMVMQGHDSSAAGLSACYMYTIRTSDVRVLATLMWRQRCVQEKHGSGEEGKCLC